MSLIRRKLESMVQSKTILLIAMNNITYGSMVKEGVKLGIVFLIPVLDPRWEDTHMTPNDNGCL